MVMFYAVIAPLSLCYGNQVVWRIPEELMKRVSQSRCSATMLLEYVFVNRDLGDLRVVLWWKLGRRLLIDLAS
jgi:hypothetical protein